MVPGIHTYVLQYSVNKFVVFCKFGSKMNSPTCHKLWRLWSNNDMVVKNEASCIREVPYEVSVAFLYSL